MDNSGYIRTGCDYSRDCVALLGDRDQAVTLKNSIYSSTNPFHSINQFRRDLKRILALRIEMVIRLNLEVPVSVKIMNTNEDGWEEFSITRRNSPSCLTYVSGQAYWISSK
jgi:hypothetical protein